MVVYDEKCAGYADYRTQRPAFDLSKPDAEPPYRKNEMATAEVENGSHQSKGRWLEKGLSINLSSADESKYRSPNPSAAAQLREISEVVQSNLELPAGRLVDVPADGLPRQTVDWKLTGRPVVKGIKIPQHYRQTVDRS